MEPKNNRLSKIFRNMKSSDFIYSIVVFIFFIIVVILFLYSTSFIVKNVNKIFSPDTGIETPVLDLAKYSIVVQKLNLPTNTQTENPIVNTPAEPQISPNGTTPTPNTGAAIITTTGAASTPVIDKKSITINILNTTSKKGAASALAKILLDAGFSEASTGNEKTSYALTTILVKDGKKDYTAPVLEVVQKSYPKAITDINPETSQFDVVIIIGKQ